MLVCDRRNRDIWGEDADVWRPARWTDGTANREADNIGPYENLYVYARILVWLTRLTLILDRMSFGAGHRACIGWRYACVPLFPSSFR